MCIRHEGAVKTNPNGQKQIRGIKPTFSNMNEQTEYGGFVKML